MDVTTVRSLITVACFVAFLLIVFWAYNSKQKTRFDEAANLPFADDDMQHRTLQSNDVSKKQKQEN